LQKAIIFAIAFQIFFAMVLIIFKFNPIGFENPNGIFDIKIKNYTNAIGFF
jgi:hypothetical protein